MQSAIHTRTRDLKFLYRFEIQTASALFPLRFFSLSLSLFLGCYIEFCATTDIYTYVYVCVCGGGGGMEGTAGRSYWREESEG